MEVIDSQTGEPSACEDGIWRVTDQRRYIVKTGDAPLPISPFLRPIKGITGVGELSFDNYVGQALLGGERFSVKNSKLTQASFDAMLDDVVERYADLAFGFDSPTAVAFQTEDVSSVRPVAFHTLAYLRHVMLRLSGGEALSGQFLEIARNPHRKMVTESAWLDPHAVDRADPGMVENLVARPDRMERVRTDSSVAGTALASRLRRGHETFFPSAVQVQRRLETFDTHENRLVLDVLRHAEKIVHAFANRPLKNPDLSADIRAMQAELEWLQSFSFLGEVGALTMVPVESSVMQRRDGYREFLSHHLNLGLNIALSDERDLWHRLLDLKECSLLYEIWTFLMVKKLLDQELGPPQQVQLMEADDESRRMSMGVRIRYPGKIELRYNPRFLKRKGSYSLEMRPDIIVKNANRLLVLDAKLKFAGERLAADTEDVPDEWGRAVVRDDLLKMHAYRDSIRGTVGAFVLYPGTTSVTYKVDAKGPDFEGVGAVPLETGEENPAFRNLLKVFLET